MLSEIIARAIVAGANVGSPLITPWICMLVSFNIIYKAQEPGILLVITSKKHPTLDLLHIDIISNAYIEWVICIATLPFDEATYSILSCVLTIIKKKSRFYQSFNYANCTKKVLWLWISMYQFWNDTLWH